MNKHRLIRLSILCLVLIIGFSLIAGRGCPKRSRDKTRAGSSDTEWRLNAPSNLIATAVSTSQINLSWQYNFSFPPIDGFEIERRTSDTQYSLLTTVSANTTSYSDTGLSDGITYYYRVRAFNTIGDRSIWSNEASATTFKAVWSSIAAGEDHSIILNSEGIIYTWGLNEGGQLGIGNNNNTTIPTWVDSDAYDARFDNISAIAGGSYHTVIVKRDPAGGRIGGTIWTCGVNDKGQLGLGDSGPEASANIPFPILGTDSDWSKITGGYQHTVSIKTNGTLWAWGLNDTGQLGLGYTLSWDNGVTTPTQVGTDSDWSDVSAGIVHNLGIKTNRTLWSWGYNGEGQLGLGNTIDRNSPTRVGTDSNWSSVYAANWHNLGIKTDGTLWAWGANWCGQLGLGYTLPVVSGVYTPTPVGTNSDWSKVTGSRNVDWMGVGCYSLALKIDNTLWAWGNNGFGQLGLGYTLPWDSGVINTPTSVGTDSDWSTITAGATHSLGIKTNRTLWAWGNNNYGQLGLGDMINRNTPTLVGE